MKMFPMQNMKKNKAMTEMEDHPILPKDRIAVEQHVSTNYIIYFHGEVVEANAYLEEFEVLRNAQEGDVVLFRINNSGGDFDTAVGFVNAIKECRAHTVAFIEGMCASAATMVALACDQIEVAKHVAFMIHCPSGGFIGKFNDVHVQSHFYDAFVKDFYYDIYLGFLEEDEIEDVLRGTSLWFNSKDTKERLQAMIELRQYDDMDQEEDLVDKLIERRTQLEQEMLDIDEELEQYIDEEDSFQTIH